MCQKAHLSLVTAALLLGALTGCTENAYPQRPAPPPLTTEPIGSQMTRAEPRLAGTPFRVLLDFERETDLVFINPRSTDPRPSTNKSHTGRSALRVDQIRSFDVKLNSLLPAGSFPGNWTVVGAYFSVDAPSDAPAKVTISWRTPGSQEPIAQNTVEVTSADRWTPVFLDLIPDQGSALTPTTQPNAKSSSSEVGILTFHIESNQPVFCDDVVVINNARVFQSPQAESGWSIRQTGLEIIIYCPKRFRAALKTPEAFADGWTIEETSDIRARFVSVSGKTWTIYADGEQYMEGEFSPIASLGDATPIFKEQHAKPADLSVPEELGRVDRDTPGDRNNDGYNERRGSYELAAKGPRFEVTIKPNTPRLARPVLEIAGLPQGETLVTVEGQLIEKTSRLPDGNLLVQLPMTIERPTTVNVTVK